MTEAAPPLTQVDPTAVLTAQAAEVNLCQNCGAAAPGKYCSACGQSTDVHMPSLGEFLHEFVSHHIAIEGALIASVKRLLLSPGGLTLDYFSGKRARYVAPLRLYLTFNVIFFLAVQLLPVFSGSNDQDAKKSLAEIKNDVDLQQVLAQASAEIDADQSLSPEQRRVATDKLQILTASAKGHAIVDKGPLDAHLSIGGDASSAVQKAGSANAPAGADIKVKPASSDDDDDNVADAQQDREDAKRDALNAVRADLKPDSNAGTGPAVNIKSHPKKWQQLEDAIIPAWVDQHAPVVRRRLDAVPNRTPGQFRDNAVHYAPYTLLMLLPVCAFLLQLSFIGCHRRYVEHLVAALHGHTFLFITLLLLVPLSGWFAFALVVLALIHMIMALSRIYGSRGIGLVTRLGVLLVSYTIAFSFATAGEFVLSILT